MFDGILALLETLCLYLNEGAGGRKTDELGASNALKSIRLRTMTIGNREVSAYTMFLRRRRQELKMLMRSKELCKTVLSLERLGRTKRARGGWDLANGIAQPDAFTEKYTTAMHSQNFQAILVGRRINTL